MRLPNCRIFDLVFSFQIRLSVAPQAVYPSIDIVRIYRTNLNIEFEA